MSRGRATGSTRTRRGFSRRGPAADALEATRPADQATGSAPVVGLSRRTGHSPEDLLDRFHMEKVPSPSSGVVHHIFWRR